ncbi:MAG: hypothetical protein HY287_18205 [Planctomycetes bacterium]|nr:hypothetical protein [Planctomycetota bacterium]MBI3836257.1 hypothetical protein [Planctomycetota bacterium]
MKTKTIRRFLIIAAFCGILPVTAATCDPVTGAVNFFRDDDSNYYDSGYYGDVYVPVCDPFYCY